MRTLPFLQACAILSFCTALAISLSAEPQRPRPSPFAQAPTMTPPSTSISSSSSSSSRAAARQRRRMKAPLVDSDLLRFLNEQKLAKQRQLNKKATTTTSPIDEEYTLVSREDGSTRMEETFVRNTLSRTTDEISTTTTTTTRNLDYTTQQQHQQQSLWLQPYNAHRVTSLLLSKADNNNNNPDDAADAAAATTIQALATTAGERVQSQALARTARRRVREFLKQRDDAWSRPAAAAAREENYYVVCTNNNNSETEEEQQQQEECTLLEYDDVVNSNIEQVVDLMMSTEYGLTIKDVCEILIHTPGLAMMQAKRRPSSSGSTDSTATASSSTTTTSPKGETLQQTLDRVLIDCLQNTLQLRKYDARKLLRQTPGLLTRRGSQNAQSMLQLLQQLGVSAVSIARDKQLLPYLLSRSPAAVFRLVAFLASDAVRMPVQQIGPLLRRSECQELLGYVAPVPRLRPADSWRQQQQQQQQQQSAVEDASSMLWHDDNDNENIADYDDNDDNVDDTTTDPTVLSVLYGRGSQVRRQRINEIYRNMSATVWTLRHEIGTADLGKVIAAYPSVLLLDAQTQILPVAHYLMNDLGIWQDDLPRVLQLYPVLLGKPVEEMRKVEEYLLSLEVPRDSLASIFRSFPALLNMSVEQMEPVVDFLHSEIGISNVGRFISRLPPVLGYSVSGELQPKWKFLRSFSADPSFAVSKFPAYFSYPLQRVIQARFAYLQRKGFPTQLIALDQVVRYGDKDFAVKVAKDNDGGVAFSQFVASLQKTKGAKTKRATTRRWRQQQQQPERPR